MFRPTSTIGLLSHFGFLGLQAAQKLLAQWKRPCASTIGLLSHFGFLGLQAAQKLPREKTVRINDWPSQSLWLSWPASGAETASPREKTVRMQTTSEVELPPLK